MTSRARWLILSFAVIGLGVASASSWVHYRSLTDPTYVSPCDINATFNCTQVYLSQYGSVAGIPVALGGVIWFGMVGLIAAFADPNGKPSAAAGYLRAVSVVGLGVIAYYAYISWAVLKMGCVLCMGTYICVLAIFALAWFSGAAESLTHLPTRVSKDVAGVFARPAALVATLVFFLGAATLVAFFPDEQSAGRQAAATPAPSADVQAAFADSWAKQPRLALGVPADGAKIIFVKFNDYECPSCAQAEMYYKPMMEKFSKANPGALKYVTKDWPWNTACNFNAGSTIPGHEAACDASAAARMAKERGKYEEMAAWLYGNQGVKPEAVRAAATRILGVQDFDREYAKVLPGIRADVADGGVLGINGTPTYFLNGVRLPSGMRAEYVEMAMNIEMKRP